MSTADQPRTPNGTPPKPRPRFSRATIGRFSLYLRCVQRLQTEGARTVSSSQLGEALGVSDAQVRKDLASLSNLGHRGVGYPVQELLSALQAVLGMNRSWSVIVVGVGNLARALMRYRGFHQQGFHIVGLFDTDPAKIGQLVEGLAIQPTTQLPAFLADSGAELAMLTVPSEYAQTVADQLVQAGIRGILNFAPAVLRLPAHVHLIAVDLSVQLEQLASLVHLGDVESYRST
jgi:redox-sensing transcriptional repressor